MLCYVMFKFKINNKNNNNHFFIICSTIYILALHIYVYVINNIGKVNCTLYLCTLFYYIIHTEIHMNI